MRWIVICLLVVMFLGNLVVVLDADKKTVFDRATSLLVVVVVGPAIWWLWNL